MKDTGRSLAMLSGVGLCLLGVAATLAYPASPEFVDEPAKIAAFYGDNSSALLGANSLYLLGGALMMVFAAALRSILSRAEGGDGRLSTMAFGGIVAGGAIALAGTALDTAAALRVDDQGSIAPDIAAVMADAHGVLFGMGAPMAWGVAALATAVLAFRTSVLPTWLAGLSTVLGIALLVPPIAYIAAIVFTWWCLVTGIVLYLQTRSQHAVRRGGQPAEPGTPHTIAPGASASRSV